jgi:hypothetical protein
MNISCHIHPRSRGYAPRSTRRGTDADRHLARSFPQGDVTRVETIDIDEPAKEWCAATGRATRSSESPASKSIAAA